MWNVCWHIMKFSCAHKVTATTLILIKLNCIYQKKVNDVHVTSQFYVTYVSLTTTNFHIKIYFLKRKETHVGAISIGSIN